MGKIAQIAQNTLQILRDNITGVTFDRYTIGKTLDTPYEQNQLSVIVGLEDFGGIPMELKGNTLYWTVNVVVEAVFKRKTPDFDEATEGQDLLEEIATILGQHPQLNGVSDGVEPFLGIPDVQSIGTPACQIRFAFRAKFHKNFYCEE